MYFVPVYPYPYYSAVPFQDYRGVPLYQPPSSWHDSQIFNYPVAENETEGRTMDMGIAARQSMDYGTQPYVVNIHEAARRNNSFRTSIWTGNYLQVVVMSIQPGSDIGLEVHQNHDQFLRIEEGEGLTRMGNSPHNLTFEERISRGSAIMVPAGKWHNIINTGNQPLKLYTIYAPPEHPFGTVHETKEEAIAAENQ